MEKTRERSDVAGLTEELAELRLAPLAQDDVADELDVYPLGVYADNKRPN